MHSGEGSRLDIYIWEASVYRQSSLVAQMIKHSPAMKETWVQSLG